MDSMSATAAQAMPGMASSSQIDCDGTPFPHGSGTWRGHVLPGLVFLAWGLHWAIASLRSYLQSSSGSSGFLSKQQEHLQRAYSDNDVAESTDVLGFRSRAWYPLSRRFLLAEPLLKILVPLVGVYIELYGDHEQFMNLRCSNGTFAARHVHNWQHAASYPAFFISGIVDLVGTKVQLPQGTRKSFLALAFGLEGFLMVMHKKPMPLDAMAHGLLAAAILGGAAACVLELAAPRSLLPSMLRCWFTALQGAWLIQIAQMFYAGSSLWVEGEHASLMICPVAFAMIALALAVCLFAAYVGMQAWYGRPRVPSYAPCGDQEEAVGKSSLRGGECPADGYVDDSANGSSDSGSDAEAPPRSGARKLPSSAARSKRALRRAIELGLQAVRTGPLKPDTQDAHLV